MQLKMKDKGEVVDFRATISKNRKNKKRYVDIEFGLDREQLEEALGGELATRLFAGYVAKEHHNDDGEAFDGYWATRDIKLSERVVSEVHRITIGDEKSYQGQPQIVKLSPVENTEKVVMRVRLEFGEAQTHLRHLCEVKTGSSLVFEFIPSSLAIPLEDKARGKQMDVIRGGLA
jgi:hypothetical protein